MNTTPELVTAVMRERDRTIERNRLARVASCLRACTDPTLIQRVARVFRGSPATC